MDEPLEDGLSNDHTAPVIGLLTRTLSDSPVVKYVVPLSSPGAFLRLGDDSVQRWSWTDETGAVQHGPPLRLPHKILAATAILGSPRKNDHDYVETDSKHTFAFVNVDTLVLSLESGSLELFIYGEVHDIVRHAGTYPLPRSLDPLHTVGKFLSVDPEHRSLAVAAPEHGLILYDVRHDADGSVKLERDTDIMDHARIVHMDFLQGLEDVSALILIKISNNKLVAQTLEWPHQLGCAAARSNQQQRLIHGERSASRTDILPDLMIPLSIPSGSFIIAGEDGLFLFTDILSGHAKQQRIELPSWPQKRSQRSLWVKWQRCIPASVLIFRDDGMVVRVSSGRMNTSDPVSVTVCAGFPLVPLAVYSTPSTQDNDVIIAFASDGECGAFQFEHDFSTLLYTQLASWPGYASCIDLVCPSGERKQHGFSGVFVTSQERVCEVRPGFEAVVLMSFDLGEVQPPTMTFPVPNNDALMIFLSPKHASTNPRVLALDSEDVSFVEDSLRGLEIHDPTLALFQRDTGMFQVTDTLVHRIRSFKEDSLPHDQLFSVANADTKIIAAAEVSCHDEKIQLAILTRSMSDGSGNTRIRLHLVSWSNLTGSKLENTWELLSNDVTAFNAFRLRDSLVCLVSDVTGQLQCWCFGPQDTRQSSHWLSQDSSTVTVAESIMLINQEGDRVGSPHILCSLRNGTLKLLQLNDNNGKRRQVNDPSFPQLTSQGSPDIVPLQSTALGTTTVTLTPLLSVQGSRFAAACGSRLYLITYSPTSESLYAEQVWLTDRNDAGLSHENITAVVQIQQTLHYDGWDMYENLVIVMGSSIFLAKIYERSGAVPRSVISSTNSPSTSPNRLIYSNDLAHFAVSSTATDTRPDTQRLNFQSIIEYLPVVTNDRTSTVQFLLQAGEKVFALAEWRFEKDSKRHVFTMVGTGISAGSSLGRLHILRPRLKRGSVDSIDLVTSLKFDDPVYSLFVVDAITFICGHGSYISLYIYSPEEKKWKAEATFQLSSPAVSISYQKPVVYITTLGHSLMALQLMDEREFVLMWTDSGAATGTHHITLPMPQRLGDASSDEQLSCIGIISTKRGQLRGLAMKAELYPSGALKVPSHKEAYLAFTAQLPRSITRLRSLDFSLDPTTPSLNNIGLCTDGTLYGLTLLSAQDFCRLKFLEILIRRSPLCVLPPPAEPSPRLPLGFRGLAPPSLQAEDMHVNGDVLGLLVLPHGTRSNDPIGDVEEMLRREADGVDRLSLFVRERLEEELRLVPEVIALARRVVKGWGMW